MSEFPTNPSDVSNQMGPSLAQKLNADGVFPSLFHQTNRYFADDPGMVLQRPRREKPFAPSLDAGGISTAGDEWGRPDTHDETIDYDEMGINDYNLTRENHHAYWDITVWGPGGKASWVTARHLWVDTDV
jgi:hypothetical protein